jgi:hypothetical protein
MASDNDIFSPFDLVEELAQASLGLSQIDSEHCHHPL